MVITIISLKIISSGRSTGTHLFPMTLVGVPGGSSEHVVVHVPWHCMGNTVASLCSSHLGVATLVLTVIKTNTKLYKCFFFVNINWDEKNWNVNSGYVIYNCTLCKRGMKTSWNFLYIQYHVLSETLTRGISSLSLGLSWTSLLWPLSNSMEAARIISTP